jgi:chromosome segregation ATPase
MRDLPHLIRRADTRRSELRVELLARQVKKAQEGHRQAERDAERARTAVEEVRRAYTRAASVERKLRLEAQRLEGQHHEETERLERLRAEAASLEEKEVAAS